MHIGRTGKRLIVGRKLRSAQLGETLLPKRIALPIFASDALSSVAYAPDEIFLTLSIAGLLSERARHDIDRLPGLGDIPILGALFRSREYRSERTELVFLVTPYYAWPDKERPELPTDNMEMAGDAEAIFLGHLEKMYGVGSDGMRGSYNGSVGFVLD